MTFVFGALLEYALVNYASRSDAQRLAKKKVQKQWEIDHQSFDPLHMEDALPPGHPGHPGQAPGNAANNGGSFAMVSINHHHFICHPASADRGRSLTTLMKIFLLLTTYLPPATIELVEISILL